jgi:hypothetical protein
MRAALAKACLIVVVSACGGRALLSSAVGDAGARGDASVEASTSDGLDGPRPAEDATVLEADAIASAAMGPMDAAAREVNVPDSEGDEATAEASVAIPDCPALVGSVDGGGDDAGDGGDAALRTLRLAFTGGTWTYPGNTNVFGMGADSQGRVYLQDTDNVYVIACGSEYVYMTAVEASGIVGRNAGLLDLDVASDGSLFIEHPDAILHSTAPHQAEIFQRTVAPYTPQLAAIDNARVAVTGESGLTIFSSASSQTVYTSAQIDWQAGCVLPGLAVAASGVFLYQPGCNTSPLVRGKVDGSGVSTLAMPGDLGADNFLCSARDPAGGFYTLVSISLPFGRVAQTAALYHVDETSPDAGALVAINTQPSFLQTQEADSGPGFAVYACSMAVDLNGTVFIQSGPDLWTVSAK